VLQGRAETDDQGLGEARQRQENGAGLIGLRCSDWGDMTVQKNVQKNVDSDLALGDIAPTHTEQQ
jgi:hypothetical protein